MQNVKNNLSQNNRNNALPNSQTGIIVKKHNMG